MKYIFFDLYTYNLKQAESIRKLWLRCCPWVTFFGTIFFIDRDDDLSWQSATVITEWDRCSSKYANNSRLMDTSCFIKLAVILVTINNMHFFYTACFFITILWRLYYFSVVWLLTFYWHTALRYTVLTACISRHYLPKTYTCLTRIDYKFELMRVGNTS